MICISTADTRSPYLSIFIGLCAQGIVLSAVAVGVGADQEAALLDAAVHGRVVGGGQCETISRTFSRVFSAWALSCPISLGYGKRDVGR